MPRNYKAARTLQSAFGARRSPPRLIKFASPEQQDQLTYGPAPIVASGGFGAGKTLGFTRKILLLCDLFPGLRVIIARRVWDELKKTTMKTFFKDCPPEAYMFGGRWSEQEKVLRLNPRLCEDGKVRQSEILFLYFKDNPEVQNILRGLEVNAALLDQGEEIEEEFFDIIMSRLGRWDQAYVPTWLIERERRQGREWAWWSPEGKAIPPTFMMMTVNPSDELHWIFQRFHEDSDVWKDKYKALGYRMVHMSSLSNRFLPLQNRMELLSRDDEFKRRFVFGQWGNPEGQIHRISPLSLVPGTPDHVQWVKDRCRGSLYRVLDHGDSSPTSCTWWGVDEDGNAYCYQEYYEPDQLISYHRQRIFEWSKSNPEQPGIDSYRGNVADPSIFNPTIQKHDRRYSVAEEYHDAFLSPRETAIYWSRGINDELALRNRINEYLQVDPDRIHPFSKERGSPRIFFLQRTPDHPRGCYYVIRETSAQRREKIGTHLGKGVFSDERDDKVPDHAYDTLRYFVGARPPVRYVQRSVVQAITADFILQHGRRLARPGGIESALTNGPVYFMIPPTPKKPS